ncbi:MAG: thiosulfate oxidation carrier protein SoxY [Gammaproteobacteria bacterium]|nr:thiosulfate oxidation carrier protein SoxY [Gammaproteobacteria bacterium]
MNRRLFLQQSFQYGFVSLAITTGLLHPIRVWAKRPDLSFKSTKIKDAINFLHGNKEIVDTDQIQLKAPTIAENGATVPLAIKTSINNIDSIAIFVEKNAYPLASHLVFHKGFNGNFDVRVKMSETSDVYVVAEADGKLYQTHKSIKVTLGGCGG